MQNQSNNVVFNTGVRDDKYYDLKLGLDYNLGKDLSKSRNELIDKV